MGCEVQLSMEQPYFKTEKVKVVTYLHYLRALIFFAMSFIVEDVFMILLAVGVAEAFVAWWFGKLKMESWGLSFGVCLFHFLYPMTFGVSLVATGIILTASVVQMVILGLVRAEGGYSYTHIAMLDQAEMREATPEQKRMLQLAVIAQGLKTLTMFMGGFTVQVLALGFEEILPWSSFIPLSLVVFSFILADSFATIGLATGREWGFHLTLVMVPISFIETLVMFNPLAFLLSIWVLTIFIPCLARDGFYSKVLKNVRKELSPQPKK